MDVLSVSYLPVAIGLGALHALEPGHAKTMTAAYLVGIHGRWHDAVLLGLAAAATHSLVVITLAVTAVLIGRQAFAGEAVWWLQIGSGAIVVALGSWMLWRRLRRPRKPPHLHADGVGQEVHGRGQALECRVAIQGTFPDERMHLFFATAPAGAVAVSINRGQGTVERLTFTADGADPTHLTSRETPREPHAFSAVIEVAGSTGLDRLPFSLAEHDHGHGHEHLDDEAHARAHAEQMPAYIGTDVRPSWWQVVAFGAAGGLVPCPASISVMLLAVSIGSSFNGVLLVFGFSVGLAVALVGVGLLVVVGLRRLDGQGRFAAISRHAPAISAGVVVLSGLAAILMGLLGGPEHGPSPH